MDIKNFSYKISELNVDPDAVCKLMGYGDDCPPEIMQMVLDELEGFSDAIGIEGGFLFKNIDMREDELAVYIDDHKYEVGKAVFKLFRNSTSVAAFICTAGEQISKRSQTLMAKGDLLEGYVVDVIGNEVVERAMDKVHAEINSVAKDLGCKVTNRYSPGYCDWHVKEQHMLFSYFPDGFCNVKLSDSALMSPIKSLSGFIGVGKDVSYKEYTCHLCQSANCLYSNRKPAKAKVNA